MVNNKKKVEIILSSPCFELWFLNHFEDTTAYMDKDEVIKRLEKHLGKKYHKNRNYSKILNKKLDVAIINSKKQHDYHIRNGRDIRKFGCIPSTLVTDIIELIK